MSRWSERMKKKEAQKPAQKAKAEITGNIGEMGREIPTAPLPQTSKKRSPRAKMGRPPDLRLDMKLWFGRAEETVADLIFRLAKLQCTQKEVAAALGIHENTLIALFKREPDGRDIYERGLEAGKISLRRSQAKLADKNATMAIFLGMNYLGQEDKRGVQMSGKVEHEHSVIGAMLKEIDEEARGARRLPGDDAKVIEHRPEEKNGGR